MTPYELVKKVELDPETYSSQRGGILMTYGLPDQPRHPLLHASSLNSLINLDRPYHTPLRMEHMQFFRPGFVAELKKRVDVYIGEYRTPHSAYADFWFPRPCSTSDTIPPVRTERP